MINIEMNNIEFDNIEIAPEENWIDCKYHEALLYCFQLDINGKIGWRLPTENEFYHDKRLAAFSWFANRDIVYQEKESEIYKCAPVRDII